MTSRESIKLSQIERLRSLIVCTSSRAGACRAPQEIQCMHTASVFFSLFWLADCGQGCVQHYGTSRCNTWPCGHQDKLDLLKAKNRADARTLLTCGPSTSWLIHMLTRFSCHTICSEACQSWDFTATDALITSVLQLSRCDKTPQSLCTQQRKPLTTLCCTPESPTTAEALWKCDESTN